MLSDGEEYVEFILVGGPPLHCGDYAQNGNSMKDLYRSGRFT